MVNVKCQHFKKPNVIILSIRTLYSPLASGGQTLVSPVVDLCKPWGSTTRPCLWPWVHPMLENGRDLLPDWSPLSTPFNQVGYLYSAPFCACRIYLSLSCLFLEIIWAKIAQYQQNMQDLARFSMIFISNYCNLSQL